jgi:Dihydrofolate reductase
VVSRNPEFKAEGAETFTSLEDAIDACSGVEKAFIIGGAQIYDEALMYVDKLIITEVDIEIDGDAFFLMSMTCFGKKFQEKNITMARWLMPL